MNRQYDLVIVGGGLAGCLFFAALKHYHPHVQVLLIEKADKLAGNHTWCLHEFDIPENSKAWFTPLLSQSWPHYDVYFPEHSRKLNKPYHSIKSEDLAEKLMRYSSQYRFNTEVLSATKIEDTEFIGLDLGDDKKIVTSSVLFARGWKPISDLKTVGWQKFVGLEVRLRDAHNLVGPILKDVRVPQIDGYRFVYSLPFSLKEVLIEDTYYSTHPGLKVERIEKEIHEYAARRGWVIEEVLRKEVGALPLAMVSPKPRITDWPSIGAESNFFNPVTGYTLPMTLRLVQALMDRSSLTIPSMKRVLNQEFRKEGGRLRYYAMLNRMMFLASKNEQRYRLLERFYRLPEPLIERFYSGQLTWMDQARILMGKPPVPLADAMKAIRTRLV